MMLRVPGVDNPVDVDEDGILDMLTGWIDTSNWPMWVALGLVAAAITYVGFRLAAWLKSGAVPILMGVVLVIILIVVAGASIEVN